MVGTGRKGRPVVPYICVDAKTGEIIGIKSPREWASYFRTNVKHIWTTKCRDSCITKKYKFLEATDEQVYKWQKENGYLRKRRKF